MTEKLLEYTHDGSTFEGLLVMPPAAAGLVPGVLIAHAWGGRGEIEAAVARRLAGLGYAALAIDMYGKGIRGTSREENAALIAPLLQDRGLLQARINRAAEVLGAQPQIDKGRIAALGYCFGGLCVLDLARSGADVRGVISMHGLFTPPSPPPGRAITASVLALHGYDDPMVPVEAVTALAAELSAAGADWQIHAYGGTMHAFTNPNANDAAFGTVYSARADRRSWNALQDFLSEIFG